MSVESVEVRVARLEENMKFLVQEAGEAKQGRKVQYETNDLLSKLISNLTNDMKMVTDKLAGQAPTIEEFITIKHKVEGAGKLGKFFWVIGTAIISVIGTLVAVSKGLTGH